MNKIYKLRYSVSLESGATLINYVNICAPCASDAIDSFLKIYKESSVLISVEILEVIEFVNAD